MKFRPETMYRLHCTEKQGIPNTGAKETEIVTAKPLKCETENFCRQSEAINIAIELAQV